MNCTTDPQPFRRRGAFLVPHDGQRGDGTYTRHDPDIWGPDIRHHPGTGAFVEVTVKVCRRCRRDITRFK